MRIAFVSVTGGAPWGGSEEHWCAAAHVALHEGHQVAVSVYRWPERVPKVKALGVAGAQIHYRPAPRFHRFHNLYLRLRHPFAWLDCFRPDVVCINQGGVVDVCALTDGWLLAQSLLHSGTPFVLLSHGTPEYALPPSLVRCRCQRFFPRAKYVAFDCRRTLEITERQLAQRLPNGIVVQNPTNLATTALLPWPSWPPRLAIVGRVQPSVKGHDLLLEALNRVSWRSEDWKLRVYGTGEDLPYVQELASFYELKERIEFRGHVTDIAQVWRENHLAIVASRNESAPLALVEAMICGRPTVATDVGGIREFLQDGDNGFLAEAAHVDYLRRALERAWSQIARWEGMGKRAHAAAMSRMDHNPGKTLLNLLIESAARPAAIPSRLAG
jgi:glycosyltransferase involved in cell wall biosynthesis